VQLTTSTATLTYDPEFPKGVKVRDYLYTFNDGNVHLYNKCVLRSGDSINIMSYIPQYRQVSVPNMIMLVAIIMQDTKKKSVKYFGLNFMTECFTPVRLLLSEFKFTTEPVIASNEHVLLGENALDNILKDICDSKGKIPDYPEIKIRTNNKTLSVDRLVLLYFAVVC
jgi:hypothetical protein